MKKENLLDLFWAIVWGLVTVLAIVGIFWNPSSVISAVLSGCMFAVFVVEYIKEKRKN